MPETPLHTFLSEEQIAGLPDQRGLRSWAFEPYLALAHEPAEEAVDNITAEVKAVWLKEYTRKPNEQRRSNFSNCVQVFLINLLRAYVVDDKLTVGIPSQKERLGKQVQYRPRFMTVDYYRMALQFLVSEGYVEIAKRGHRQQDYGETARYRLGAKAMARLPVDEVSSHHFTVGRRHEVIQLKDSYGSLIRFEHTPVTQSMHENLRVLNNLLERTNIGTTRTGNEFTDFKSTYNGEKAELYRVFNNNSFEQGGRFYGGWWIHAKKHFRKRILIDGEPTVEVDYKGLHPAILFAQQGLDIPVDPYALIPGVETNPLLRGSAKTTFLALMNAKKQGTCEPKEFDEERFGMTAREFRKLVRSSFPMLPDIFESGRGVFLQYEDSKLAESILMHFAVKGIPVLSVHDSFIVAEKHQVELEKVMLSVFQEAYGQRPSLSIN